MEMSSTPTKSLKIGNKKSNAKAESVFRNFVFTKFSDCVGRLLLFLLVRLNVFLLRLWPQIRNAAELCVIRTAITSSSVKTALNTNCEAVEDSQLLGSILNLHQ